MGVGAFIMAEMIGISYAQIALSAIIPALAYYLSIFLVVHFIAKKRNLMKQNTDVKVAIAPMLPRLYRLIPIIVVVTLIFTGSSLTRSALIGVLLSIIINLFSKQTRMNFAGFVNTMLDGIRQAASIAIPTAACGIMIGIVVRSGAANKFTTIIATVGGSNLLIALILAMFGCLILGMALPTVAAYLIANILFCPTLITLGIPSLQANMFIFYFGVIAQITPPVCLASFTAAGIARANSWKTGWKAFGYAIVTFLTPFIFVFQPSVLLIGTLGEIIYVCVVLSVATVMLAAGLTGYLFGDMHWIFRVILVSGAVCVAIPESITDAIGFIIATAIGIITFLVARKKRTATS
jgi:TRAP transporter 4TM/12TM fusion protein